MKIVFLGTPAYIEPILKTLEYNFDTISVRNPSNLDINKLQEFNPDLFVVAAFGKILSKQILSIPKLGAINAHPSLLPKYRGPSPVQWTLLNGDKETGATLILMDEEVDHGPILWQEKVKLTGNETFESLVSNLFDLTAKNIVDVINRYTDGDLKPVEQKHENATFTKTLTKNDGFIDLNELEIGNWKLEIARKVRAYFPWPGVWFKANLSGQEKIIKLLPNDKIQVEGKKPMSYKDFENGYKEGKQILQKLALF